MDFGAQIVDLAEVQFTTELLRCIPAEVARKYRVLPVSMGTNRLAVAVDRMDLAVIDDLCVILNREIEIRLATEDQLEEYMQRLYGNEKGDAGERR